MLGVNVGGHHPVDANAAPESTTPSPPSGGRPQPSARRSPDGSNSVVIAPHHGGGFKPDGGLPTRTGRIR